MNWRGNVDYGRMRRPSTDVPSRRVRGRIGQIEAVRTATLYVVNFGQGVCLAQCDSATVHVLGETVPLEWDQSFGFWRIPV